MIFINVEILPAENFTTHIRHSIITAKNLMVDNFLKIPFTTVNFSKDLPRIEEGLASRKMRLKTSHKFKP